MYKYFIAYAFQGGQGSCVMELDKPLFDWSDFRTIGDKLGQKNNINKVIVTNFQLLESPTRKDLQQLQEQFCKHKGFANWSVVQSDCLEKDLILEFAQFCLDNA